MSRTASYKALVLRVRPSGEHREASFLTAEEGILRATVFGGAKSRFRSHVAPFNSGTLWIYRDPVKDSRKVNDFDVVSWRPGLRELYERSAAANAMAAAILASSGGGGSFYEAIDMAVSTLDVLENADEGCCTRLLVRFLWNWAGLLGQQPGLERCSSCACEAGDDGLLWFIRGEGLLCTGCFHRSYGSDGRPAVFSGTELAVGRGARRWLAAAGNQSPSALIRMSLDDVSLAEAKALTESIINDC